MENIKEDILREFCRKYCKKCLNVGEAAEKCDIIRFDAWVQVKKLNDTDSLWDKRQQIAGELFKAKGKK